MKRIWTVEEIKSLLETRNDFVERSLVKLYEKQTFDEQVNGETRHNNNVGFNGADSKILSSFCVWLLNGHNRHLSVKQMYIAKRRIMKYSKQITKIANGDIEKCA
jgi:hypothetical protein